MKSLRMKSLRSRLLTAVVLLACATAALPQARTDGLQALAKDRRGADQTYLTFPEWFLVFSPDEYAGVLQASQPASSFPFFSHAGQFWGAYRQIIGATRGKYPFNGEYHTMIVVIGVSTTVEYAIKGAYETLVGRLTELTAAPNATAEDRLATQQARAYVNFIRVRPWYEFDFVTPLKTLWTQTPWWGNDALRKWERRYALTSEWIIKAGYAALIKQATRSTFDAPRATTVVVIEGLPDGIEGKLPELRRLYQGSGQQALVEVPRYQAFTDYATTLSLGGSRFVEIAGNRGLILVSVVAPVAQPVQADAHVLIRQPILTRPGFERRVLEVPVARLDALLSSQVASGDPVEHVFDY